MAGTFPDVPSYRFAYDSDGTTGVVYSSGAGNGQIFTLTAAEMRVMNQTQSNGSVSKLNQVGGGGPYFTLLFPEARNITGYFIICETNNPSAGKVLQTSSDTTTGQNGNWETIASPYNFIQYGNPVSPLYRSNIQSISATNVTAIRFATWNGLTAFHLYGSIVPTESPDRLRIVDLSGDDIAAQLDFGDIRQRNNVTKQFKVVNNSSTKTANNITVTFDVNPDASPTLIGQYQLSTDNTAYANAINIGTLAPGQSSTTLYVRDAVSATAQLGPWALRIIASANTWS